MRLPTLLCGLWAALILAVSDAHAEKRVALVIGNSAYQNANRLANPAKDANAVAGLFRNAGFEVVETKLDLGNLEFKRVARDFTALARNADIAVVYFAGHGIEVNGTNYLLPVDAKLVSDFDVEDEALSLDRVMRAIEPAKRLRLVILDACRDNPFVRTMQRSVTTRNVSGGLAKVEPVTTDTLVAFATRPGATAEDGQGDNSPFAAALVKNLAVPGRDIRIALGHVRDDVMRSTGSRQEPFVAGSLGGAELALVADASKPQEPTRQISVLPNPQAAEPSADPQRDYEFAERVGTRDAWDSFLAVHPSGFYASLARPAARQAGAVKRADGSGRSTGCAGAPAGRRAAGAECDCAGAADRHARDCARPAGPAETRRLRSGRHRRQLVVQIARCSRSVQSAGRDGSRHSRCHGQCAGSGESAARPDLSLELRERTADRRRPLCRDSGDSQAAGEAAGHPAARASAQGGAAGSPVASAAARSRASRTDTAADRS